MFKDKFGRWKINVIVYKDGTIDYSEKKIAHWELLKMPRDLVRNGDGTLWVRVYIYLTPHKEAGWYRIKRVYCEPAEWFLRDIIPIEKKLRKIYESQCAKNNFKPIDWCKPFI